MNSGNIIIYIERNEQIWNKNGIEEHNISNEEQIKTINSKVNLEKLKNRLFYEKHD